MTRRRKEKALLLESKNAVIYGGSGAVGGAVAGAFAREGATVFLAGHTLPGLDVEAQESICRRWEGGDGGSRRDGRASSRHATDVKRELRGRSKAI